jgi:hypothetical protein
VEKEAAHLMVTSKQSGREKGPGTIYDPQGHASVTYFFQ